MLSTSCFFMWEIGPLLCMSNRVIPHWGISRINVFSKCWPMTCKFPMFFRAVLPTYCVTFSKLFRARPELLVLGNTHRQSARKTLWLEGETESCWESGVWWAGDEGRIFIAGRVLSLSNLVHFKGRVQGTGKLTFQAPLQNARMWPSSAAQTGMHWDSILPGGWKVLRILHTWRKMLKMNINVCHWFIPCSNSYNLTREARMFM